MGHRETRLEQYTLLEQLAEGDSGACFAKLRRATEAGSNVFRDGGKGGGRL